MSTSRLIDSRTSKKGYEAMADRSMQSILVNAEEANISQSDHLSNSPAYEEFFSGSVPCPSCRGLGRIPKEQEGRLVALIPLDDNRLKPRRTLCYVAFAISVCLVVAGLLLFFLLPRSVELSASRNKIIPSHVYINTTEKIVTLSISNVYNITNNNFFGVDITDLQVTALFNTKVIGQTDNTTTISLPIRAKRQHQGSMNITFKGDDGYIASYCSRSSIYPKTLLMPFEALAQVYYLGHTEEVSLTSYQHVQCSPPDEDMEL